MTRDLKQFLEGIHAPAKRRDCLSLVRIVEQESGHPAIRAGVRDCREASS